MPVFDTAEFRRRIVATPLTEVPDEERAALNRTLLAAVEMADAAGVERAGRIFEDALERLFEERMSAISQSYFGEYWAEENAYSIWARLTNDPRAWGYGSENELGPLRWLVSLVDCWFDGQQLVAGEEWRERYERWACQQESLVRRMTPGALGGESFPPSTLDSR
jgi:hypothetical protein